MPVCVGTPFRALRERQTRREAGAQSLRASLLREVARLPNSEERWRTIIGRNQGGEVLPALESLGALEDMVDALVAKVDYLDKRLGKAEVRLEEIAAEQD